MTYWEAFVLGLVQGLGEFLPISSSAHLILVPWLFNWPDPGLTFDVALHLGTLIALLFYFRKDWLRITFNSWQWLVGKDKKSFDLKLGPLLAIASVPAALIGLLLEKQVESAFRSPVLIAVTLTVMGLGLFAFDKWGKKKRDMKQLTVTEVFLIGAAQALALIPGVSRSGSTISAGLALGLTRESAARFSFYMSMPITAGACVLQLRKLHLADLTPEFFLGVVTAAASGFFAIDVLLRLIRTRSYGVFAVYRVALSVLIVALILLGFRTA